MKKLIFLAAAMLSFSAMADVVTCKEILPRTTSEVSRPAYVVKITKLADVSHTRPFLNNFDAAWKVRLDVTQVLSGRVLSAKAFEAFATMYDVQFQVSSVKVNNFSLNIFMDELDESSAVIDGKEVNFNCDWN